MLLVLSSILILLFMTYFDRRMAQLADQAKVNQLESIPDMQLTGYDPSWLYSYASKLSSNGRQFYLRTILIPDFAFPIVYSFWFAAVLSYAFSATGPHYLGFRIVLPIPFLAALFDFAENLLLFQLLSDFPDGFSEQKADFASAFTQLKWGMILLSFVAILVGVITSIRYVRIHRRSIYRPQ